MVGPATTANLKIGRRVPPVSAGRKWETKLRHDGDGPLSEHCSRKTSFMQLVAEIMRCERVFLICQATRKATGDQCATD